MPHLSICHRHQTTNACNVFVSNSIFLLNALLLALHIYVNYNTEKSFFFLSSLLFTSAISECSLSPAGGKRIQKYFFFLIVNVKFNEKKFVLYWYRSDMVSKLCTAERKQNMLTVAQFLTGSMNANHVFMGASSPCRHLSLHYFVFVCTNKRVNIYTKKNCICNEKNIFFLLRPWFQFVTNAIQLVKVSYCRWISTTVWLWTVWLWNRIYHVMQYEVDW